MKNKQLEEAIALLLEDDDFYSIGNIDEDTIFSAELFLNIKFPDDYKKFLESFGALSFGAEEVYGITNSDFEVSEIPNAIWYTKEIRKLGLPKDLILIGSDELGSPCIDTSDPNGRIVLYHTDYPDSKQNYQVIAACFGEFLLEKVKGFRGL